MQLTERRVNAALEHLEREGHVFWAKFARVKVAKHLTRRTSIQIRLGTVAP